MTGSNLPKIRTISRQMIFNGQLTLIYSIRTEEATMIKASPRSHIWSSKNRGR